MQGRSNAGARSTTGCASPSSTARTRRRRLESRGGEGALPLALCAAIVLAGCGGDDDDPPLEEDPPEVAIPVTGSPLDIDASGIDAGGPAEPAEPSVTGEEDEPEEPAEDDPDGDDVPGLAVNGLDGRDPADVVSPWFVNATFFRLNSITPGSGDARVSMVRYGDDFPFGAFVDFYAEELDTCELNRGDSGGDEGESDGELPLRISGGSSLTINTPAGPWFVLESEPVGEDGTEVRYATNDGLPGPLPDDATLSIPGDAFPNVAAFELPDEPGPPIRLLPYEEERLGPDTVYTWIPGDGSDYVELDFIAFDPETGDFIDFPLTCMAVDDGEFTPSDEARAFLATTTDDVRLRYSRERDTLTLADGIVFRARVIVAE